MAHSQKLTVELTKKEADYVAGMIELYRDKLETLGDKRQSETIDKEVRLASRIERKFATY